MHTLAHSLPHTDRSRLRFIWRILFCKALKTHSWVVNTQSDPAFGVCERCGVRREWPD